MNEIPQRLRAAYENRRRDNFLDRKMTDAEARAEALLWVRMQERAKQKRKGSFPVRLGTLLGK